MAPFFFLLFSFFFNWQKNDNNKDEIHNDGICSLNAKLDPTKRLLVTEREREREVAANIRVQTTTFACTALTNTLSPYHFAQKQKENKFPQKIKTLIGFHIYFLKGKFSYFK